jgi:parallel beta-helix repeat protein
VTIEGNKLSSCLTIQNSNVHFNIQYCNFNNSSFGSNGGILLINTSNGKIIGNNFTNNPSGIRLEWCNNIFIEDNNILDSNDNGVIVWNSNYIQIIENFVNFSSYGGIKCMF